MDTFFGFFRPELASRRRRRFADRVKYRTFRFLLFAATHSGKYSRNRANSAFANAITGRPTAVFDNGRQKIQYNDHLHAGPAFLTCI